MAIVQQYSLQTPANLIGGKRLEGRRVWVNPRAPFATGGPLRHGPHFCFRIRHRGGFLSRVRSRFVHDWEYETLVWRKTAIGLVSHCCVASFRGKFDLPTTVSSLHALNAHQLLDQVFAMPISGAGLQ